jgi:MFS family permease
MRRVAVLAGVAAALFILYMLAYVYLAAFVATFLPPTWWRSLSSDHRTGILSWFFVADFVGLVLISIPFAFVIDRVYGRTAVPVALGVTALTWFTVEASSLVQSLSGNAQYVRNFQIAESAELLTVLGLLVWIVQRLPSNNRMQRPRGR